MNAASILLVLAAAGQAGWAPERSTSPPPAAPSQYDRYAQPPAASANGVGPPPTVADRTRTAGAATRGDAATPPWSDSSATSAPDWEMNSTESGPSRGATSAPRVQPIRTDSGWTSIGSQVAAPQFLLPQLTTASSAGSGSNLTTSASGRAPMQSGAGDSSRQNPPPASGADSWAIDWGNNASASPATISRSAADTSRGNSALNSDLVPVQTADARSQNSQPAQPQGTSNWADLWGEKDPWADTPQSPPASNPPPAATGTASAAPPANNPANQPIMLPPANNPGTPATATGIQQTSTGPPATGSAVSPTPTTEQPPWMPLLVVSLSLAGSLGANLFLGWSYLDARQKYRTLVRKTADTFRRKAAA